MPEAEEADLACNVPDTPTDALAMPSLMLQLRFLLSSLVENLNPGPIAAQCLVGHVLAFGLVLTSRGSK